VGRPEVPSSPESAQLGAASEVQVESAFEVESAPVAVFHTPGPKAPIRVEQASARERTRETELVSAKTQSRRPKESAPQKKENSWSALAPQYWLLKLQVLV
jgi:hypothetical protein